MFSIVIPIYNEEKNIVPLINEILESTSSYRNFEIIIINDQSTDSSIKEINKEFSNYKFIKILENEKNKGQSYSLNKGIETSQFKIIITIDGDGQNDPSDIPKLLDYYISNESVKLVGGIRKKRKDSNIKKISSIIANKVRSTILRDNCMDTGCSLKVFNKNIFLSFPYFDGIHRFLPALFKGYGYQTFFINVNHRQRKYGYSKYGTMNRLFKGVLDIIKVKKIIKENK